MITKQALVPKSYIFFLFYHPKVFVDSNNFAAKSKH